MANKEELVVDGAPSTASRRGRLLSLLVVGAVFFGEGAAIFVVTKMFYKKPADAVGAQKSAEQIALENAQKQVEVCLPELNAFNKREGRLYVFNLQITIRVRAEKGEEVRQIIEARNSTILDRFNTVIRSAEAKYLNEPGLDTIRRQLRFELDRILGDDQLVLELLIPKFFQSPANV